MRTVELYPNDPAVVRLFTPVIFNTLRILKRVNPGDTYYENYLMKLVHNPEFFDQYHLAWLWGIWKAPKRMLEIGTRTGLSLCQLLSSLIGYDGVKVTTFDLFNDGYVTPQLVRMNLKALNIPTDIVEFIEGNAAVMVPRYLADHPEDRFDWVLVDGDHSKAAARIDLENVAPVVAPGGILVFDDISDAPGECALIDVWMAFKEDHPEFDCQEDMSGKGTAWGIRKGGFEPPVSN